MLLCTIGISGSGKSLLCDKLEAYFGSSHFANVEPDDLRRKMLGNVNDQSHGDLIFKAAGEAIKKGLDEGKVTFFNATNVNWPRLRKFIEEHATGIILYIFMLDSLVPSICIERIKKDLHNGVDRSEVPEDVVMKQFSKFQEAYRLAKAEKDVNIFRYDGQNLGKLVSTIEDLEEKATIYI